ncbi:hypothetical protein SAMN05661012_01488 [Chitinophaga sancti]|uniref:Uncharacterized protein n=1 Tax=Chitinophaga sancti TaxID=1004 RepID=A0A1K1NUM3_9BACT|nr:hypothetical protein SAMN05661012_01488 [Chitinophaga sancti]
MVSPRVENRYTQCLTASNRKRLNLSGASEEYRPNDVASGYEVEIQVKRLMMQV